MGYERHPSMDTRRANAASGAFPGLAGLTEPLTDLVSGMIDGLRGLRSGLRERARRQRTLDTLNHLDRHALRDIGIEPGDLVEVASRNLPLEELARRRNARSRRRGGRLDTAIESRRPAVNDESFRLVA